MCREESLEGLLYVILGSSDKQMLHLPDACADNIPHQNFLDVLRWNARPLESTCRSEFSILL